MANPDKYSKDQLTTPTRRKGKSTLGPDHDGGPKDGFLAEPGEPGLAVHHSSHSAAALQSGPDAHGGKPNLARDGKAKAVHGVPLHSGMTGAQAFGAYRGGLGHPTSTAVPGVNPIDPNEITKGKELKPAKIGFGMTERSKWPANNNDTTLQALGKAVLAEALKSGGK